jgi:hypothetical protein
LAAIVATGLQPHDPKPIEFGGVAYPYVWRVVRVVAAPASLTELAFRRRSTDTDRHPVRKRVYRATNFAS